MRMMTIAVGVAALLGTCGAVPARAAELLINGTFSAGLAGWSPYVTGNGVAAPAPAVFDLTGGGATTVVRFQVGQVVFEDPDYDGSIEKARGGGLFQTVTVAQAGPYRFAADYAASTQEENASGGVFALVVDGLELVSAHTGPIEDVARGRLSYDLVLQPGDHVIAVQATRPFMPSPGTFQYFGNVTLSAVPEPATWAMMIVGFAAAGGVLRRRRAGSATAR